MSYIITLDSTYQIPDRYSIVLFDNMHQTGGPISIPGCDRTQTGHCPESSLMMINESDPVYARRQHHPATQAQSRCSERGIILTLWEPKYECGTDCQNIDFSHEKLAANLRAAHARYLHINATTARTPPLNAAKTCSSIVS